jgi:IS5 family transposase
LYGKLLDTVIDDYGIVSRDSATDGGFASFKNQQIVKEKGIVNIVFNKVVGRYVNIPSYLGIGMSVSNEIQGIFAKR